MPKFTVSFLAITKTYVTVEADNAEAAIQKVKLNEYASPRDVETDDPEQDYFEAEESDNA